MPRAPEELPARPLHQVRKAEKNRLENPRFPQTPQPRGCSFTRPGPWLRRLLPAGPSVGAAGNGGRRRAAPAGLDAALPFPNSPRFLPPGCLCPAAPRWVSAPSRRRLALTTIQSPFGTVLEEAPRSSVGSVEPELVLCRMTVKKGAFPPFYPRKSGSSVKGVARGNPPARPGPSCNSGAIKHKISGRLVPVFCLFRCFGFVAKIGRGL